MCISLGIPHLDEKWFYIDKIKRCFYQHPDEETPVRCTQNKRHIQKIMFLAIVARPRYDHHKKSWWNGLIGIWPFAKEEPAKRTSKNRVKGTMELKATQSVTGKEHEQMMLEKVLPALKASWPSGKNRTIYIQMDNAKPHTQAVDKRFHMKKPAKMVGTLGSEDSLPNHQI